MNVTVEIKDNVFNPVYQPLLKDTTRLQILFGGSSSGKSVFEAQRCIFDLLKGGRNYLCCRNVGKTIRTSIFNELVKVINLHNLEKLFIINLPNTVTCINGFQALMTGLDDVEKTKSITPAKGVITDVWVEEATEVKNESDLRQLSKRLRGESGGLKKRITLTFNPILKSHWIYKRFFSGWLDDKNEYRDEDIVILKTTYKDNRFLEPDDIKALEDEADDYFYKVYTLGQWGVLGGIIFTNWKIADVLNDPVFKTFDVFRNGLDFGFTNDPTAFNRMYYHRASGTLYVIGEWHEKGVTNDQIALALKPILNGDSVTCDSAEPKSITELNNYGLNACGARKGKDSVMHGIQWLQQQKIIIDRTCQHTVNEFEQYHWQQDKYGETLNRPVDKYNHHIDDIRYACEDLMLDTEAEVELVGTTEASLADW